MDSWRIKYKGYDPGKEPLREALCTVGNGYFATRGAAEECQANDFHYPGTYLAGGYNRLETEISGKIIENEDLVNWPDWTLLKFKPENGEWLDPDKILILNYEQELNLKNGILERRLHFKDSGDREFELKSSRIVSMNNMHVAAIQWKLIPKNWEGKITVHSALDGTVENNGVQRYRELNKTHLKITDKGCFEEDCIYLKAQTTQSKLIMAQAARTFVYVSNFSSIERSTIRQGNYIAQEISFDCKRNKTIRVEKLVSIYTSKDNAISEPLLEAKKHAKRADSFRKIKKEHISSWKEYWDQCDINIELDDPEDQLLLRLHIFHIFQTYSLHTIDLDAGAPARGLHGEAYRGHIFWDELFIFPFFTTTIPELTRSLLLYRHRRLPEARFAAKMAGFKGAMFPWQSGSNGREESQVIHLNPESGRWVPDNTHLQRHVNAAIAYNVWEYYQTSGDLVFLSFYGAEILLDIANFWASITVYNEDRERFEIHNVVGPDEYHTKYPGSDEPGVNNNAYTNFMAVWSLVHALKVIDLLDKLKVRELMERLEISYEDLERWDRISRKMFIPFVDDGKIIEQFEGFDQLKELDWKKYHETHGEILRLDRILEKEGDEVDNYKAVKQADVLMLFYLFASEELKELFERLGYNFEPHVHIQGNIAYYEPITAHGSTLCKVVHSWVLARSKRDRSWHHFQHALDSDFKDIQGGTTAEGIHLGAMAGTVDIIQRCYTGMEFREDGLWFNPRLPDQLKRINFRLRYREHWLQLDITKNQLCIKSREGQEMPIKLMVREKEYCLRKGEEMVIDF